MSFYFKLLSSIQAHYCSFFHEASMSKVIKSLGFSVYNKCPRRLNAEPPATGQEDCPSQVEEFQKFTVCFISDAAFISAEWTNWIGGDNVFHWTVRLSVFAANRSHSWGVNSNSPKTVKAVNSKYDRFVAKEKITWQRYAVSLVSHLFVWWRHINHSSSVRVVKRTGSDVAATTRSGIIPFLYPRDKFLEENFELYFVTFYTTVSKIATPDSLKACN